MGPDTNDDIDDALRGAWGGNHQNDDVIYEWVLSELPCNLSTGCPKILYPLYFKPLDGQGSLNDFSK